jgi:Ala-tRNA(Pro) deacylase
MSLALSLKTFLDEHKVNYHVLKHDHCYTSQEIAAALHVSGKHMAKVVMVKANNEIKMMVLPSASQVDLEALADTFGVNEVELAQEEEFQALFPDCEVGAMPPFGNLYGIEVFVDKALTHKADIFFEAGNHDEAIKLGFNDFKLLVKPKVADFTIH